MLVERQPQQIAEPREHGVGGVDVAVHQRRDRVQRVEQEVRVQLPLQRLQLRFGEARLSCAAVSSRSCDSRWKSSAWLTADDRPVGHHLPVEVEEEQLPELQPPVDVAAGHRLHDEPRAVTDSTAWTSVDTSTPSHVHGAARFQVCRPKRIAARHPQHERHQQRPRVPVGHVERQQHVEGLLPLGEERDVVERLQRGEDAEHGRHAQDCGSGTPGHRQVHLGTIDPARGLVKPPIGTGRRHDPPVIGHRHAGLAQRLLAPADARFVPGTKTVARRVHAAACRS